MSFLSNPKLLLKKLYGKVVSLVSTLGTIAFTSSTAMVILYLPLVLSQDQEKYALHRLMASAFGIKLENQEAAQSEVPMASLPLGAMSKF